MAMRPWSRSSRFAERAAGDIRRGAPPPAFTLAELLVVLCVTGVLLGGVALSCRGLLSGAPSPEGVRREAERAASWLQRVFHGALLSRRGLQLSMSSYASQRTIVVRWDDSREKEVYDGGGQAFFINQSMDSDPSLYSPKWNTLTPALTIRVTAAEGARKHCKAVCYIVISPFMRVTVATSPP
ncbi:MAG: hypothetical protein QM441_04945 [Synergistota bacterium]|nr:hypothetical protein [Synergistota bacterium]